MEYTKENTEKLVLDFQAGISIVELAKSFNTSERSIIAKLSSLGIYKKQEYLNKRGEPPRSKAQLVEDLAKLLGYDLERLESLEKANKGVLQILIQALK